MHQFRGDDPPRYDDGYWSDRIGGTIIDRMITTMITRENMTVKMIIGGIVVTIMIVTIHHTKIEMIVALIEVIDITMIDDHIITGEIKTIDHIIVDFRMTNVFCA